MEKQLVKKFFNQSNKVKDHRYRSWENSHNYFLKLRNKDSITEEERKIAELQLAFYLASWGMYRGSSFVLQKDYTIYSDIIDLILKDRYNVLWDIQNNLHKKDRLDNLFQDLYKEIEGKLVKIKETIKEHDDLTKKKKNYYNYNRISQTLVTKIILGTIGCIPAYDRIFKDGINSNDKIQKKFNPKKSFKQLLNFYEKNKKELDELQKKLGNGYTIMKIIDMYFWEKGREEG